MNTPGRWTIDAKCSTLIVSESVDRTVATAGGIFDSREPDDGGLGENIANARLIAAAPDLLAACEMIASFAQSWQPLTPGDIHIVKDAIEKAKGQP